MRTDTALAPTLLSEYTPPNFEIETVDLTFRLDPEATEVSSRLSLIRKAPGPLVLQGEAIKLKSVSVDGRVLPRKAYTLNQTELVLDNLPGEAVLEIVTECAPASNSTLMGLYQSGGRYCTQCEAEGFRRITYFMDRPDVLSTYRVRVEAPAGFPYLLANGNMVYSGDMDDGWHFAVWEDPFPKPCYLFALVAGEFDILEDDFTTMSGRNIPLTIYVDPGDAGRADYAMDALKRSMKWDEDVFGREYDLDRFMIVAVRDFNFGAMENKGLNIFNSALLLADAETATDMNFERIESVVAHEYFHNWTGNRITCRDWFQLCLKEGFTVYRDQEFSADQRGAAVQRIKDVRALRARQFPEDTGPLAHPVRPDSYLKIDNFYTATIYEKGAELVRMIHTLLGPDLFRKGCDYYFDTYDGTAATVEDFITSFETATDFDLSQFKQWYSQAGTPKLSVKTEVSGKKLICYISQNTKATPGQSQKNPQVIPIKIALVSDDGRVGDERLVVLTDEDTQVAFEHPDTEVSLSILRGFSAPVQVDMEIERQDYLRLMKADDDLFNRWDSGQTLAALMIRDLAKGLQSGRCPEPQIELAGYASAISDLLGSDADPAFIATVLQLPQTANILPLLKTADPIAVSEAINLVKRAIAERTEPELRACYRRLKTGAAYSPDAASAGRRALRNLCLSYLSILKTQDIRDMAFLQFETAKNMTDEMAALVAIQDMGGASAHQAMNQFYDKWKANPLVVDKWFLLQSRTKGTQALNHIKALTKHADFDPRNPNRTRALVGGFAATNVEHFHRIDGLGYDFFTDQVLDMDSRNPQVAARLLGVYEVWPKLDKERQALIRANLQRVIDAKPSKNVLEIAHKTLKG